MIPEKVTQLLKSKDNELYLLGMNMLMDIHPAMWCVLMNYTGFTAVTSELLDQISRQEYFINIGHQVRYKGIPDSPIMVVTDIRLQNQGKGNNLGAFGMPTQDSYSTMVAAKYWNKSSQVFSQVQDRIECFEILNKTKKQ